MDKIKLRCFACNRVISDKQEPVIANCGDDQWVYVGPDCGKRIKAAGAAGYQPPLGRVGGAGPVLFYGKRKPNN